MWTRMEPRGLAVEIEGASRPGIVHKNGMVVFGNDGKMVGAHSHCCYELKKINVVVISYLLTLTVDT